MIDNNMNNEIYIFDGDTTMYGWDAAYRYAYDLRSCGMEVRLEAADTENDVYYYSSYPVVSWGRLYE